jgi:hypothetical protein
MRIARFAPFAIASLLVGWIASCSSSSDTTPLTGNGGGNAVDASYDRSETGGSAASGGGLQRESGSEETSNGATGGASGAGGATSGGAGIGGASGSVSDASPNDANRQDDAGDASADTGGNAGHDAQDEASGNGGTSDGAGDSASNSNDAPDEPEASEETSVSNDGSIDVADVGTQSDSSAEADASPTVCSAAMPCAPRDVCQYADGLCGRGLSTGVCMPRPVRCLHLCSDQSQICGCDGVLYCNTCLANQIGGVDVTTDRSCFEGG